MRGRIESVAMALGLQQQRPAFPKQPTMLHQQGIASTKQWKARLLLGLVGLCLALVVGFKVTRGNAPPLDGHLCEQGKPLPAHHVVLIDPTDPLSPVEANAVRTKLLHYKETLKPGERLTLLAIMPDSASLRLREFFSRCRPEDGTNANELYVNKGRLQRRYREQFEGPLKAAIKAVTTVGRAHTSPMLETLYKISTLPTFEPQATLYRTLLIISDLLERSQELNQYQLYKKAPHRRKKGLQLYVPPYNWADVQQSPQVRSMQGRFAGVEVHILLRTKMDTRPYQHEAHRQLWTTFFQTAGAASYQVQPL